jgi:D-3-phosphoglycerate dehydrogenase
MKPSVLLFHPTIMPVGVDALRRDADVTIAPDGTEATLTRFLSTGRYQAAVTRTERITREVLEASQGLCVIGQHGAGLDNIDVEAATARGVAVVHCPLANYVSVAEHVVLLVLAVSRRLVLLDRMVRRGDFTKRDTVFPAEIHGKVALVIGMGRVGRAVAERLSALGMKVLGYDPFIELPKEYAGRVEWITVLKEGLERADCVSVNVPLTSLTRGLINAEILGRMKPTSWLINTSRGGVVDTQALVAALKSKRIAGAALDVFDPEPPPADSPLFELENIILTPHLAGDTMEARNRCSLTVAEEVLAVLKGQAPRFLAIPTVGAPAHPARRE